MEVGGGEGDYIPIATVTSRMTFALSWAVMRAILFHNCEGQSHKTGPQTTTFEEKRAEADSNRGLSAYR